MLVYLSYPDVPISLPLPKTLSEKPDTRMAPRHTEPVTRLKYMDIRRHSTEHNYTDREKKEKSTRKNYENEITKNKKKSIYTIQRNPVGPSTI